MRIGVDASCWANARGYGRYARELLRAVVRGAPDDTFFFFVPAPDRHLFDLEGSNVRVVMVRQSTPPAQAASASGHRSLRDMLRFTSSVRRHAPDVFFCPSVYTYFPLPPGQRALVAIHDAIAERYPGMTLPSPRARWFWWAKVHLALRQARLILTVSDYAARDLQAVLGLEPRRIRVSGEAPAPAFRPGTAADARAAAERIGVPPGARWFVYVGGFNPHKRLDVQLRAHRQLADEVSADPPHLILVGAVSGDAFHGNVENLREMIQALGLEQLVHWAGFVPDEQLRHLLTGSVALLLVSECEGFGLPAVEAAACGTPVIATTESPLPDLLRGGGLFVDPGDDAQLLDAMRRLWTDSAARDLMAETARRSALRLSWDRSARAVLAALREAAE